MDAAALYCGYRAGGVVVMDRVQGCMDGPGAGMYGWTGCRDVWMDRPGLLHVRLGELVPRVGVKLRSWGWGLASLP